LVDGEIQTTNEGSVGDLPVAVPMVDVHSVGAGGGSLARFDAGGALRVGPQSAGADPGPICYGRGMEPTVTDAHLVLGRLHPDYFLGGEFRLDLARTREVISRWLERPDALRGMCGGRGLERFAQGVIAVANATMEKAIRIISVERGHDPRRFTLVAFGGAGGLHACELAVALRIPRVLITKYPGGLSALGILRADPVKDFSRTVMLAVPQGSAKWMAPLRERLDVAFAGLEAEALRVMRKEGFCPPGRVGARQIRCERALDLRYVGQAFELTVPLPSKNGDFVDAFHRLHERRYGYADAARPVEIVNVRLRAVVPSEKPELPKAKFIGDRRADRAAIVAVRPVVFSDGCQARTPFYHREWLRPGNRLAGPAVIVEYSATTVLPPGWRLRVDGHENLILELTALERGG
jgi:N-methylhydantoinase A